MPHSRALILGLVAVVAALGWAPAAVAKPSAERICVQAFPGARQATDGKHTTYNRQASVQAVTCSGIGSGPKYRLDPAVLCTLVAQGGGFAGPALSSKAIEYTALFNGGACDLAEIAAEGHVSSSLVCGILADLLGKAPEPRIKVLAAAFGVSCALGKSFGGWLESMHQRKVARSVMASGSNLCLRYTKHGVLRTDKWDTVRCAKSDRGFSTLPPASVPPSGDRSPAVGPIYDPVPPVVTNPPAGDSPAADLPAPVPTVGPGPTNGGGPVTVVPGLSRMSLPGMVRDPRTWHLHNSNSGGAAETVFDYGRPGDIPIVGDWNGDGIDTPGIVRDGRTWHLKNSLTGGNADFAFDYGRPGDIPIAGDWNGDGIDTPGIVRDGRTWHLHNSNSGGAAETVFDYGRAGDIPIVGDWNGDGIDTPGIVRDGRTWHLHNSNSGGAAETVFDYGRPGDIPIVGDWNGDGIDTPGIVRDGRTWHLKNSLTGGNADFAFDYGRPGDIPIAGDWKR